MLFNSRNKQASNIEHPSHASNIFFRCKIDFLHVFITAVAKYYVGYSQMTIGKYERLSQNGLLFPVSFNIVKELMDELYNLFIVGELLCDYDFNQ